MKPLEGKTALVTGAAGKMGLAATRFLLEDGARVAMVDLSESRMHDAVRGMGGEINSVKSTSSSTTPESSRTIKLKQPATRDGGVCWASILTAHFTGRVRCFPA